MTREQVAAATGLTDTFELDTPRGLWRVTLSDARPAPPDGATLVFSYEGPQHGDLAVRATEEEATSEHALRGALRTLLSQDPVPADSGMVEV